MTSLWLLVFLPLLQALDLRECNRPLGMNSKTIKDDQITASSSFDLEHTGPQNARLRLHTGGGAWCPQNQINATTKEWLQISFGQEMTITAIATEGRFDEGRGQEYPTAYRLEYWRSSLHGWAAYKDDQGVEIIRGNVDTRSEELRNLDGAIVARRIRVIPVSNGTRTVCMRLEIYGCPYKGLLESYSISDGSTADGLAFKDFSYDGVKKEESLEGGLGKLYDGLTGHKNFEHQPGKWVGWRKQSSGEYVTLTFNFFENQNLSAILIHTNNIPTQLAPAFSSATMAFSYDGVTFSRREIHYNYPPDSFETARWVRIPIPDRVAKVLELKLFFGLNASWLLISEVKFETNRITFHMPEDFQEDITFHHFLEGDSHQPSGLLGTVVMLAVIFSICFGIFCCIHIMLKKRDRVKAASPPPNFANRPRDMKVCLENGTLRHVTQSTYQMAVDNMKNTIMEKCPLEVASDYAEPEIVGSDSAMIPLLSSFNNYGCDYASSSSAVSTFLSCPLSPAAKYNDYGEVYTTILPEIERNKLEFIEKIGHGEFGEVHLCKLESRLVAVKRMHGGTSDEEYAFHREIRVLGSLKHPNVVEVIGVSINEKPLLCIMEYMKNGDLKSYLGKKDAIDTPLCMSISTQLAAGLAYLESCSFVHRDIAARNCLVDAEGNVKISDFGMSRSLYSSDYYRVEGRALLPLRWMAPETLLMGKFSTASDVWAFGVTVWEIFTKCQQKPYANLTDDQIVLNLQQADSHLQTLLPRPPLCPYSVYNQILVNCWRSNPASRSTFEHIHLQLQSMIHSHPLA